MIYLLLVLALHDERDRFVEVEIMFSRAVHRREPRVPELEVGEHHRILLAALRCFRVFHERAELRVFEHRKIEIDRLRRPSAFLADEKQSGQDRRSFLAFGVREDQLPGKAVFILYPTVALAPRILVERHQDPAAFGESRPGRVQRFSGLLLFRRIAEPQGIEVHEKRDGRIEFKVGTGAYRHERLSGKLKRNDLGVAGRRVAKRGQVSDLRAGEERDVEFGRLFGLFVEPQMGRYLVHDVPYYGTGPAIVAGSPARAQFVPEHDAAEEPEEDENAENDQFPRQVRLERLGQAPAVEPGHQSHVDEHCERVYDRAQDYDRSRFVQAEREEDDAEDHLRPNEEIVYLGQVNSSVGILA